MDRRNLSHYFISIKTEENIHHKKIYHIVLLKKRGTLCGKILEKQGDWIDEITPDKEFICSGCLGKGLRY